MQQILQNSARIPALSRRAISMALRSCRSKLEKTKPSRTTQRTVGIVVRMVKISGVRGPVFQFTVAIYTNQACHEEEEKEEEEEEEEEEMHAEWSINRFPRRVAR